MAIARSTDTNTLTCFFQSKAVKIAEWESSRLFLLPTILGNRKPPSLSSFEIFTYQKIIMEEKWSLSFDEQSCFLTDSRLEWFFFSRWQNFLLPAGFCLPLSPLALSLAFKDMRSEANNQKLCCQYQWSVGVSIDNYCYTRHLEERAQSIYLTMVHILFPMIGLWN